MRLHGVGALALAILASATSCQAFLVDDRGGGAANVTSQPDASEPSKPDAASARDATSEGPTSAYGALVLADGAFAYWSFDGPTPLEDHVERRVAKRGGSPDVQWVPGAVGQGASSSGGGEYLQVDDATGAFDLLHDQSFSVEVWVRANTFKNAYNDFLERRVTPSPPAFFNGFTWGMRGTTGRAAFSMWFPPTTPDAATGEGLLEFIDNGPIAAGPKTPFVHLVLTHAAGGAYGLFVDGNGSGSQFYPASGADSAGPHPMPTQPLWIGARLDGVIDELAFYRKELSLEQIKSHEAEGRR